MSTDNYGVSADFSEEYSPQLAENSKFVVANTDDPVYEGFPEGDTFGRFVQLAYQVSEISAVDFSQTYAPAKAENLKFVKLDLDESLGWPTENYPKYGVLTYIVNPNWLVKPSEDGTTGQMLYLDASGNLYYDDAPAGGGGSVSFGAEGQVPYVSAGDADFQYGGISYESNTLNVSSTSPSIKVTDETDGNSAEWNKTEVDGKVRHKNMALAIGGTISDFLAHYIFDGNTGTTVVDVQNGHNGTKASGSIVTGKINDGIAINAGNGVFAVPTDGTFNTTEGNAYSYCFWLKKSTVATGPETAISFTQPTLNRSVEWLFLAETGSGVDILIRNDYSASSSSFANIRVQTGLDLHDDTWHHYAFFMDYINDEMALYIDGQLIVLNDALAASLNPVTPDFCEFGRNRFNQNPLINSTVDDFRIYTKRLSENEILGIYAEGNGTQDNTSLNVDTEQTYLTHEDGVQASETGITTLGHANGSVNIDADFGINLNDNVYMQSDSDKQYYGAGDDASVGYDGTDLVIDPAEVGSGSLILKNKVNIEKTVTFSSETDNGNSGAADTIDWGEGNKQGSLLTDNVTFTFTAPDGPCGLTLKLTQDDTGSRTVTWPANVKWPSGTAPTLSTAVSSVDILSFYYDGADYYGAATLDFQ